jgi:flagellar P-ring protein precursor FlgI
MRIVLTNLILLACIGGLQAQETILRPRIVTITKLRNMSLRLEGHGLVTGLNGTGSTGRLNRRELVNLVRRHGINATISDFSNGGVAVVRVRATLRPFAKRGQFVDVYVSNIGDSTSLKGGDLVLTDLREVTANGLGKAWVGAQGGITISGDSAIGGSGSLTINHPTAGIISGGGQVLHDLESSFFSENGDLELQLLAPSVMTAASIAAGMRRALGDTGLQVVVVDPAMVRIIIPEEQRTNSNAIDILMLVRDVRVQVENPSTVIVDETTGMIIAGGGVMISPCVVALSDLTISVISEEQVVQPFPGINQGTTEKVNRTHIELLTQNTDPEALTITSPTLTTPIDGATVGDLLSNLQALKLTPRQMITVFQALREYGYLHAELKTR